MIRKAVVILPLLFLATMLTPHLGPLVANAVSTRVGHVCLADASSANSSKPCPASSSTFNGPFPSSPQPGPTQILAGVYISNSDAMNAFDITVLSNASILKPAAINLAGSVLTTVAGSPTIVLECVGGSLIAGAACPPRDTPGTIQLTATTAAGAFTNNPINGLLFTAVFNITGTTPVGGITIGYETGCSRSSIAGSSTCVTIADGTNTPVPETVQTGSFNNSSGNSVLEWFAETSNVTSVTTLAGANRGNHVALTATAPNGLPILGSFGVNFTAVASKGFTSPVFFPTPICSIFNSTNSCTVNATLSTATIGTYFVTFYENYVGDNCGPGGLCSTTYSLVGTLTIRVNVQGVSWTVNGVSASASQRLYFTKGTFSLADNFTSIAGYTGTLTLSTGACIPGTTGVICPVALPPPFTLPTGGSLTKLINFTTTGYGRLGYRNNVAATGLPTAVGGTNLIFISGFSIASNSTNASFSSGGVGNVLVTLTSLGAPTFQFAGSVTISSTVSPSTGFSVSCIGLSVTLSAGGTATTICSFSFSTLNSYDVTITGTGGTNNLMTNSTTIIAFRAASSFMGLNANITGSLGVNLVSRALTGATSLTVVNATSGAQIYSRTRNVTMTFNQFGMSHFVEDIPTSPLWLATSCAININTAPVSCFLSRTPAMFHFGLINISTVTYVLAHYGTSDALANLSGTGQVNIDDFSIIVAYYGAAVFLP